MRSCSRPWLQEAALYEIGCCKERSDVPLILGEFHHLVCINLGDTRQRGLHLANCDPKEVRGKMEKIKLNSNGEEGLGSLTWKIIKCSGGSQYIMDVKVRPHYLEHPK